MPKRQRIEAAHFVDWIDEKSSDLVNDAKAFTWSSMCGHAVVRLQGGRHAMVRGGTHGISFSLRPSGFTDPFGESLSVPFVVVGLQPIGIEQLIFHTHPFPTGPSESDFKMLEMLNQEQSIIQEICGPEGGTVFYRRDRDRKEKSSRAPKN